MQFIKDPNNPIYGDAQTGTLFDVYVTKDDEKRLRMDLSTRADGCVSVAYSADGIRWSAPQTALTPNPESGWEELVNRNCVLRIGGTYKMWYTGQAHGNSYIGYAESADGIHFIRVGSEPVLAPESPWEGESVMNPCVLLENGLYRMWYSAGETYEPNVLCYAESADGVHWNKSPLNPIFERNPAKAYEQDRIGGCQILPHKTLGYLLFYIGYRDVHTACICCARSQDGVTAFRRCKQNPLVAPDKGTWDEDSCYKPSALYDADANRWRIWYNGRACSKEYIGTAAADGDFTINDFE